ncbi:MAG TPA: ferric reductase-like transmembrane domain-containing protein [Sphingomicrobium sp.]|nr:ferric reductase-like transmembrane domain-containing protein [Sphingomicrobium sp.]
MRRISPAKLILWAVVAFPAVLILVRYWSTPGLLPGDLLASTGDWSARLIIVALMLTPLAKLFPGSTAVRWMVRHRRAFGVGAFGYALLHIAFYVLDMESVANMLAELGAPAIWTAWLAFICLLPPALTSSDPAMRRLGSLWKRVQRLAYPAAVLTLVHWLLVHDGMTEALLHFAPLAVLQLVRIARLYTPNRLERTIA